MSKLINAKQNISVFFKRKTSFSPRYKPSLRKSSRLTKKVVKTAHIPARKKEATLNRQPADRATIRQSTTDSIKGKCYVIDGDTIVINKIKIRLAGIDAPELDHPWGKNSKFALVKLCKGKIVTAKTTDEMSYDRIVAECYLPDGTDLSAALVQQGLAIDWPKFSGGKYAHLEPEGIRKKHWRAAAKQKGAYRMN